jgi:hypothetical protein
MSTLGGDSASIGLFNGPNLAGVGVSPSTCRGHPNTLTIMREPPATHRCGGNAGNTVLALRVATGLPFQVS